MAISRRAFGAGLLAASAAATGAVIYGRSNPAVRALFGEVDTYTGFIGGEKERFVANPRVLDALRDRALAMNARRAGSIEMTREKALLDQKPQYLWPSSSILVDLARDSGVKIARDQVILNSPIVIYSWDNVAAGLVGAGLAEPAGGACFHLDLKALLAAIVEGKDWSAVGVPGLFGKARLLSTDPNRSNSGFMFAGLAADLLSGDVVTLTTLPQVRKAVETIFERMGYKPTSSGKMFEDYLAGGPGAQALVVGYENQLVEWVLEDEARWKRVVAAAPAKPVVLYPRPTVLSAHPLIAIDPAAGALIDALLAPEIQEIAWSEHGFRGPLGTLGGSQDPLFAEHVLARIDAVVPMPDAATMLTLIGSIAAA
jgi:hypothetical protein